MANNLFDTAWFESARDRFGSAVDTVSAGAAWLESVWAGTASVDTAWLGSAWTGATSAGAAWLESAWTGTMSAGAAWLESAWTGTTSAGAAWFESALAGTATAGSAWFESAWAGTKSADAAWLESAWAGTKSAGAAWLESAWVGTASAGTSWLGSAWNGTTSDSASWLESAWVGNVWVDTAIRALSGLVASGLVWLEAVNLEIFVHDYIWDGTSSVQLVAVIGIMLAIAALSLMVMLVAGDGAPARPSERMVATAVPALGEAQGYGPGGSPGDSGEPVFIEPSLGPPGQGEVDPKGTKGNKRSGKGAGERNDALADIEAEMMILRELHAKEHISTEEYIAETRTLYDRARDLA